MEDNKLTIVQPKSYNFVPQPDITPLESAWIAYFFATHIVSWGLKDFEQWPLIERHFEEVSQSND